MEHVIGQLNALRRRTSAALIIQRLAVLLAWTVGVLIGLIVLDYMLRLPSAFRLTMLVLGAGASLIQTPAGRLLRRSCHEVDRPRVFAAQFALSHACWLIAYPLAGWLGARDARR